MHARSGDVMESRCLLTRVSHYDIKNGSLNVFSTKMICVGAKRIAE